MTAPPPLARIDISSSRSQLLDDHLLSTARRAATFSRHKLAELAGRWHDLGKFHPDWQLDLHANKHGRDHSTAGAVHATKHVPGAWGKTLALIIAGHRRFASGCSYERRRCVVGTKASFQEF
jgi:CRISPR-associated endonuclease/helicase Cas3